MSRNPKQAGSKPLDKLLMESGIRVLDVDPLLGMLQLKSGEGTFAINETLAEELVVMFRKFLAMMKAATKRDWPHRVG